MTAKNPMRLHWLDPRHPLQPFPHPGLALSEPNGLLAIGGDLSLSRLLIAYRSGIFPWFNPDEPILWWSPDPRTVIPLPPGPHVSRSLRRALRRADFAVSLDRAFEEVIAACSEPRAEQNGTWLGPQMIAAYVELYRRGYAHSLEIWRHGRLIGGIYGLALGRIFFGESMFSRASNGSKLALVCLAQQLHAWGYRLLDCQVGSAHLQSMGAIEIPRNEFLDMLQADAKLANPPRQWRLDLPTPPGDAHHLPAA